MPPDDLCRCLCFPHIGVLLPDGVFLPTLDVVTSSSVVVHVLNTSSSISGSGEGESLISSSTEGVSAPDGR